ncbi:hypothetical protein Daus18300_011896 [Diaporthe australafricana]|uniref:Uncharacterized protein n=1 Tax=Diaporthe australafricana TaxID=127596 RepID=A0ABR3W535_9PEZI
MTWISEHPVLKGEVWDRKAGRYDFSRFDHISSTSKRVGYKSIGEVGVDCRFHFKDSHWGTLGNNKNDAGIIHMEINFNQPPGHKLEWARIQLTLDEDDRRLDSHQQDRGRRIREVPVSITDHYGPRYIVGSMKRTSIEKSWEVEPSIEWGGIGVSLGKYGSKKHFEHESRWTFQSYKPGNKDRRNLELGDTVLRWELSESDFERYPIHKNQVFTAFAYEYGGQPFLMKVEISGRLAKFRDRLRGRRERVKDSFKFGPRHGKEEDMSTTLIGQYLGQRLPLDERARALPTEMIKKNVETQPREVPDTRASPAQILTTEEDHESSEISDIDEMTLSDEEPDILLEELAMVAIDPEITVRRNFPDRSETPSEDRSEISDDDSSITLVGSQSDDLQPEEDAEITKPGRKHFEPPANYKFGNLYAFFWTLVLYLISFPRIREGNSVKMKQEPKSRQSRRRGGLMKNNRRY